MSEDDVIRHLLGQDYTEAEVIDSPHFAHHPSDMHSRRIFAEHVHELAEAFRAFASDDEDRAKLLRLHREGMSEPQIAKALGWHESTIRRRRRKLKLIPWPAIDPLNPA